MLTAELRGVERLQAGLRRAPNTLQQASRQAMEASLLLVEADARRNVKQDTRRLAGSITHRVSGSGDNLTGRVGPSAAYGFWVEFGRRPGKRPPVAALQGWARRHGVNAYALARAIGRRGIKPAPFLVPAYQKNRRRIEELFGRVGARVVVTIARGG
jgi:hypothetical protein